MNILGLVCARGGSKGIPGKNIKELCGKPLLAWSIETALQCRDVNDVVVSTDDKEIAAIAKKYGATVPFIRPRDLALDHTKQIDAIAHALRFLEGQGKSYDAVVLFQPTCPLRLPEDVSAALKIFQDAKTDSLISVTEEDGVKLYAYYNMNIQGIVLPRFQSPENGTNRQDYSPVYRRCGLLYIFKPEIVLAKKSLYGNSTSAYVIPKERAVDIDTPFDWKIANYLMRERLKPNQ